MTSITFKDKEGNKTVVDAVNGESLMRAAVDNNVAGIKAICNGCCNCGTCHVAIEPDFINKVAAMKAEEKALLGKVRNKAPSSRLACQITVDSSLKGMRVIVK